jgi:hypothetical protein
VSVGAPGASEPVTTALDQLPADQPASKLMFEVGDAGPGYVVSMAEAGKMRKMRVIKGNLAAELALKGILA